MKRSYAGKVKRISFIPDSGSYVLVLYNGRNFKAKIGRLGLINFKKGYYVYVGTAKNRMKIRIARHVSKEKRNRWHIDYLTTKPYVKPYMILITYMCRDECNLAKLMGKISDGYVKGFGSNDCFCISHLYYFKSKDKLKNVFNDHNEIFETDLVSFRPDLLAGIPVIVLRSLRNQ